MKAFLLLFGAQMLHQIKAEHHGMKGLVMKGLGMNGLFGGDTGHGHGGKGDVCAASFFHVSSQTPNDLDDQVIIVQSDAVVPAQQDVSVGAIVTQPGAWMTIGDGSFVTIDTEQLDCGVDGCVAMSQATKATSTLGYNTKTNEPVSCPEEPEDKPEDKPTDKHPSEVILDKLKEYCNDAYQGDDKMFTEDGDTECSKGAHISGIQCMSKGGKMLKAQPKRCGDVVAYMKSYDSWAKIAFSTKHLFKMRCCPGAEKPKPTTDEPEDKPTGEAILDKLKEYCDAYQGDEKMFTEDGDTECSKGAHISGIQCMSQGGKMIKAAKTRCGGVVGYFKTFDSWAKIPYGTKNLFKMRCCQKADKPKPTPPTGKEPEKPKPPPGQCGKTCKGYTCDYWGKESGYSCSDLQARYGCKCGGCHCRFDKELKQCQQDTCYGRTCTDWVENKGVTCGMLKNVFKCTCNGCNCEAGEDSKCQNELKGDEYCDDENNIKECGWDGGDCCDYDDGHTHDDDQFSFCHDCECLDPAGSKVQRKCKLSKYQGDGRCDDRNNVGSCGWDGGDCCGKDVITTYCNDCLCKDPLHGGTRCIHSHLGDGFCDDANNVAACDFDQGDCCMADHPSQFRYCELCECLDEKAHQAAKNCAGKCGSATHKGDHYCDDDNNNCGCGWDGGDCCHKTGNVKQFAYCFQCGCFDPGFTKPTCPVMKFKGDGICDDENNVATCSWDGGDCCKNANSRHDQFEYCKDCTCVKG